MVPGAPEYVSDESYTAALGTARPELRRRFDTIAFASAEALLFPTTPCAAPTIEDQWEFSVAGRTPRPGAPHTPAVGQDRELLNLARRIESVLDPLPASAEPR